jgi:predicted nucleic acid-binding protein
VKVLVDTSAWVDFFNGFPSREHAALAKRFREMVFLEPVGIHSYLRAAEIFRSLRNRGVTVRSTIDCILAAIAEENDCAILARDRDMESILGSGLVKVSAWLVEEE